MNNDKGNNFGSGFLFGLIIGVAICLLFTTKKGRGVLAELIENGERALEDFVEPKEEVSESFREEVAEDDDSGMVMQEPPLVTTNGHKKRLFRGIRKK